MITKQEINLGTQEQSIQFLSAQHKAISDSQEKLFAPLQTLQPGSVSIRGAVAPLPAPFPAPENTASPSYCSQ